MLLWCLPYLLSILRDYPLSTGEGSKVFFGRPRRVSFCFIDAFVVLAALLFILRDYPVSNGEGSIGSQQAGCICTRCPSPSLL
jgi:hypothetical protein